MFSFKCDEIWKPRSHSENGIEINSALCGKWWWVGEGLKEIEIENINFQVEKYEKHFRPKMNPKEFQKLLKIQSIFINIKNT